MSENPQARDYKPEHEEIARQSNLHGYTKGKEQGRIEAWEAMKKYCQQQAIGDKHAGLCLRSVKPCTYADCPLMQSIETKKEG